MKFVDALTDKKLFGSHFKGSSYRMWRIVAKVLSRVKLTNSEAKSFNEISQRKEVPKALREICCIIGRRGGKSKFAAALALYLACFRDWRNELSVGERGIGMIICPDRRQGRVIKNYLVGFVQASPLLKSMVTKIGQETIDFNNGISIEIHTASYRSVRGYSVIFAILDELAFFRDEYSANPDREIVTALKPAMATIKDSMLISLSTPYSRKGVIFDYFNKYYGKDHEGILVLNAPTETMNPQVPQSVIREAYEQDPAAAAAEYGAEFRRDIESFVIREAVTAVTVTGRLELPFDERIKFYIPFCDPSGGAQDSFTLAIAHKEQDVVILDAIREIKPPFSPEAVVKEFSDLLKIYGLCAVIGDRYSAGWVQEGFQKQGIAYRVSSLPKSGIYTNFLPLINSRKCELLDNKRLINQLLNLERRVGRSGKDSIDHGPHGHDDVVNAAAGALVAASTFRRDSVVWGNDPIERQVPVFLRGAAPGSIQIRTHRVIGD